MRTGILDTGATSGAGRPEDAELFENTGQQSTKVFMLPDKSKVRATHKMLLKHKIREGAREMNIVPGLHSTLVSVPKMVDEDYIVVFDKKSAKTYDATTTKVSATEQPVLEAPRCTTTGLWLMPLDADRDNKNDGHLTGNIERENASNIGGVSETANAIFELPSTRQTILYHHASAGFPVKETFLDAVRAGNYATWPGLTVAALHKYFPDSDETQKGHMKGQRQGVRSTKQKNLVESEITANIKVEPGMTVTLLPAKRSNDIFVRVEDLAESIHSDQTGAFPYTSQRGNRYLMVAIHLDANYIFCETMKNRTEGEMIKAYQKIINRMKAAGLGLKTHRLDNEASTAYKECIHLNGMKHELVPPDNHRSNLAERAIQTFKHHFISILSGVDDKFPLSMWCALIEQAELTVNLLRQSSVVPKISAFAHVHGQHDYMKKPFAPIGCAVQVHVKPTNRRTWDTHTEAGYNLGTSMEHHRCFKIYVTKTRATRVSDTVFFKHQYITNPVLSPESLVVAAAQQLTTALKGNIPTGNETAEALKKVSELFTKIAEAKAAVAKAKEQRNRLRTHPDARKAIPLPRVTERNPRVKMAIPRVDETPKVDCRVMQIVANSTTPRFDAQSPVAPSQSRSPRLNAQSPAARPNYISQDDEEDEVTQKGYNTRSRTMTIFQEAMLACVDISKPTYVVSQDLGLLNHSENKKPVFGISAKQLSSRRFPMTWLCEMANSVIGDKGELLEYRHLIGNPNTKAVWAHSYGNEIGRLAQGMPGRNKGTNTIFFIRRDQVPRDRMKDTTYGLITCLVRPEKIDEPNRTRLVAGGDRVHYPGDAGTPTADLLTVKLLINSIISTPGAKFMTMDIKDFYLNTPMTRYEYMRLKISDMPDDVIEHYNLREIATPDGFIYCEIQKGMYGLPQAGIIAQELLADRLRNHGYTQSETTPGLWSHKSRPIQFSLVVDDFGVKYVGKENAEHLMTTIRKYYKCSCDWDGERYCGLTIKWDYVGRKVHLSMPTYIQKALQRFQHPPPMKPQNQPHPSVKKTYGAKVQYSNPPDEAPALDKAGKRFIQEVTGVFLFLARAVDGTMLTPLSALASEQASPTELTMEKCLQFLDYAATQDDAILTYKASDMILAIHSDASYLSEPKARSRAGGHMFMAGDDEIPTNNGAVLNISQIIKSVMSSAAEAELGALFINAKTAVSMRTTLEELGHPQTRTPMQTDNSTAHALLTNKILPKALKAMDMRFHWLRCRDAQGQFRYYWRPGTQNLADYWTKHHPASHHTAFRPQILTSPSDPEYTKLFTKQTTTTKSFVDKILMTPKFQEMAAKQHMVAARSA